MTPAEESRKVLDAAAQAEQILKNRLWQNIHEERLQKIRSSIEECSVTDIETIQILLLWLKIAKADEELMTGALEEGRFEAEKLMEQVENLRPRRAI